MEFKKRNISFARFLNLAFKFILHRMKIQDEFWQKRRLVSRTATEKSSRIGCKSADLKIAKAYSVATQLCFYAATARQDKAPI